MGARLVQDINPAGSSSPNELISLNGLLFFSAELEPRSTGESDDNTNDSASESDGSVGLIRSDGSDKGTTILRSFDSVTNLVSIQDRLYFIAGVDNQYQLWTSDGSTRGTKQVKDLYPNADPNFPQDLFEVDGVLFYSAIDGNREEIEGIVEGGIGKYPYINGYEVWRREGDEVGSLFFRNLVPDRIITDIDLETGTNSTLILDENGQPIPLTTTTTVTITIGLDGTTTTTTAVEQEIISGGEIIKTITSNSTQRATTATDQASTTIQTDVSPASTTATAEVTTAAFENDSFPRNFVSINGNYFFTAYSSNFYSIETKTSDVLIGGQELWFSDGTEAGTNPININQNNYTFYEPQDGEYAPATLLNENDFGFFEDSSSSFPRELTPFKNKLYFVANNGINGFELWSITDQGTDLTLISDLSKGNTSSSPAYLTVVGKNLYFSANDGSGRSLFYYNASLNEPKVVKSSGDNPESLTAIGNKLYYSAESKLGRELWSAKNNKAKLVKDINPGSESSSPSNMILTTRIKTKKITKQTSQHKKKNYLYFTADDGSHGIELMSLKINGKSRKVRVESDVINGPSSSFPRELFNHNQQLYFTARTPSKGRELWTVGPSIKGPTGEAGASTTEISIFENKTFVYTFKTDNLENENWNINGGVDASLFKINSNNGRLSFKSAPKYNKPADKNLDNIYEVYVRSITEDTGYKSDQLVNIKVIDSGLSIETESNINEILYYSENCGPITANGPLYPCN